MSLSRRVLLQALVSSAALSARPAFAAPAALRLGVLRFGTVAWEIDVMRRHGFDAAHGVTVESVEFASSPATQVALQAGAVDLIGLDWLWVTRQRSQGADWTFAPLSGAVGAIEAPAGSTIAGVADLKGKRLGIAGSAIDKSWLILRAYAQRKLGFDIDSTVDKTFGAPPLLAAALGAGRLDAMLTFWPFAAKAEAGGAKRILTMEDALTALGVPRAVPMVGYVFSEKWATGRRDAVNGFLAAASEARQVLGQSDAEWQTIAPLTGAADAAELDRLKTWYRSGIPSGSDQAMRDAAAVLYRVLAETGGAALIGPAPGVAPGTFWSGGKA